MIHNLNQEAFQGLGTILPENKQYFSQGNVYIISLSPEITRIYQADVDTLFTCHSGLTILSVFKDGDTCLDFYLDKPVLVRAGIRFALTAFQSPSAVQLTADSMPQLIEAKAANSSYSVTQQLRVENLFTFFYHEKEQDFLFPGEAHSMLELTYVDRGSMHSVAEGEDLLLQQGDMVLYGPGQWHMQYSDIGIAPRYVTLSFHATGCDLSSLYNRRFQAPQKAISLLQQMLREQERGDPYSNDMIISLLNVLLICLLRHADSTGEKLQPAHCINSENEIIRRAQQYITTNVRQKLSVPLVARNVDVSASYLTALFHKHLQISPGEYIRRIKLQESKQMIREGTMNFTEIAETLQYSTVHHFSRQFKEKFGITPTEYAKSVR